MLKNILFIAAGGAIGSALRFWLGGLVQAAAKGVFPWGTLAVNLVGCFAIGILWEAFDRTLISPSTRLFLMVGLLGGFTTFSSYGLETMKLLQDGELRLAVLNICASTFGGLGLVYAGLVSGRVLFSLAK